MSVQIVLGDCRQRLSEMESGAFNTCVTSPPYFGLRDYGVDGQIGLEETPDAFVAQMVEVFREVRRVLRDDGTLWLNIGDGYAGPGPGARDASRWPKQSRNDHPPGRRATKTGLANKQLLGIPWRVALALQADGWILRHDAVWDKINAMVDPAKDRPGRHHEYIFLFAKSPRYHFAEDASGFVGARSIWRFPSERSIRGHPATFPIALVQRCLAASCPPGGVMLDPFAGSGTTGVAAQISGLSAVLIELNPAYAEIARKRLLSDGGMFLGGCMSEHLMGREELIEEIEMALLEPIGSQIPGTVWTATLAALAALSAIGGAGFVVLPREPTASMHRAVTALGRMLVAGDDHERGERNWYAVKAYRAMINAYSPKPSGVKDE